MPQTQYISINIAGQTADVGSIEDFPIVINYSLEDPEDFQKKTSDEAFSVTFPPTLQNQKIANSFHDAAVEDLTPGQIYRNNQPAFIEAGGNQLLNGKAFLVDATHSDLPEQYEYNFYGGNGNWIIDLKEKTIYDFLSALNFVFDINTVIQSWNYDGTNEALPYVFAPVRYRGLMDEQTGKDDNVTLNYMRPAISKYWLLYWGFKSLGYRIKSNFFDTPYFRRQVMPWTWGSFLTSEGTKLDTHKFCAKSTQERFINSEYDGFLETYISDEGQEGVFDNNNEFSYADKALTWEYKAPFQGALDAFFVTTILTEGNIVGDNSYFFYFINWFYVAAGTATEINYKKELIYGKNGANLSRGDFSELNAEMVSNHIVNPGDKIIARFSLKLHEGKGIGARVNFHTKIIEFALPYFHTPIGGTIDFSNYTGLKSHKFLDFVAGVFDEYNISVNTDSINKVVYMEPTHGYNVDGTQRDGYFVNDYIDWEDKSDLSKNWKLSLFSDYEKEVLFRYKDDGNDGVLKTVQDRNQNILAAAKYLFPDRFKAGKREHSNRFFAPAMHYDAEQFKGITGVAPQMVCIIPENISNTSNSQAENTFIPKSCYYKGLVTGAGGWKFEGVEYSTYPFMFAVNYKPGGEIDPVLSYCDEKIGEVIAKGLMKHFYSQRLAIMRNGQFYTQAHFNLNDTDVSKLHREHKIVKGQRWELVQINNYQPLKSETTACYLRKWVPLSQQDYLNSFPSADSVLNNNVTLAQNDIKYSQLKALVTDIPK